MPASTPPGRLNVDNKYRSGCPFLRSRRHFTFAFNNAATPFIVLTNLIVL